MSSTNNVRFDRRWFNPLYFVLNKIIADTSVRTVLVYGGKSSSKTISICQLLCKEAYVKGLNSIAYRKESAIIPTTLKKSFNLAIDSMFLFPAFLRQDRRFLCMDNGGGTSEIVLKGLDDPEKAKGIESYQYVYLDELNHFEEAEFEQFNLSLRGAEGQKIFASWNPVDENSWVKVNLIDKYIFSPETKYGTLPSAHSFVMSSQNGKIVLIRTVYQDNYWIVGSPDATYGYRDVNLISEYESLATKNFNSYKINVLGDWGKTVYGGEFLKCWKSEKHTGNYPYTPGLAVYIIFDENVNPYFPCGIFQIGNDQKSITMIHAIALKNPDNTVAAMVREISRKLQEWGHKETVFVGGDPSSRKEDVKQEKGHDLFQLIINGLAAYKPRRSVAQSAPSVRMSKDFFNSILESEFNGLRFMVDRKCSVAIRDFENTKEDRNGKVDKKTTVDPLTKVSYQPFGHFVDLTRYFLCFTFAKEYTQYQHGNESGNISIGKAFTKNSY